MSTTFGLVIVGMHRSGTSLLTEMLHHEGWHVGSRLLPPNDFNPRGYWEHRDVVELHDEFFRSLGRTWADPRPLPADCFTGDAAQQVRSRLRELLEEDFSRATRWVIKDPRICLLLPLWLPVVHQLERPVHFLHVVRHPISSARSLKRRESMPIALGLQLWLRHNLAAERATREESRSWIHFEELVEGGHELLDRHLDQHRIPRPESDSERTSTSDSVIRPELVHHGAPPTDEAASTQLHSWVASAYEVLTDLARAEAASEHEALDRIHHLLDTADRLLIGHPESWPAQIRDERLHHLFTELRELRCSSQRLEEQRLEEYRQITDELARLRAEISSRAEADGAPERAHQSGMSALHQLLESGVQELRTTAQMERLRGRQLELRAQRAEQQLDYVEHSISWRLTAPARALLRALRGLFR